jgi:hypothetical protein
MLTRAQEISRTYNGPRAVCTCGHSGDGTNSRHRLEGAPGHGACMVSDCTCQRFTWAGWTRTFRHVLDSVRPS